jgi:hypothetical protein
MQPAWKYRHAGSFERRRRSASAASRRSTQLKPRAAWDASPVNAADHHISNQDYLRKTLSSLSPHDALARVSLFMHRKL